MAVFSDDDARCSVGDYNFSPPGLNQQNFSIAEARDTAAQFEDVLFELAADQFQTSTGERNYTYWSIVGMAPFKPTEEKPFGVPLPPDENVAPISDENCSTARDEGLERESTDRPGLAHQALSVRTGGFRYPTCANDFTDIFTLMSERVVTGSRVACRFVPPVPTNGEEIDLDTVEIEYTSKGVPVERFQRVANADACTTKSFYLDGDALALCPQTCTTVQGDPDAGLLLVEGRLNIRVTSLFGCNCA